MKTHDSIQQYQDRLAPELVAIARALRAAIDRSLPAAISKVWHGHPVWFDGDNPIVGYYARKTTVTLLFWNGRALGERVLAPIGNGNAAGKEFRSVAEIDKMELGRCLDKARILVFDSVGHFRALRKNAERARQRRASSGKSAARARTHSKPTRPKKLDAE